MSKRKVVEGIHEALRDAVWEDDLQAVKDIFDSNSININYTDAGAQTVLHLAAFWGKIKTLRYLIAAGANLRAKNSTGCTALDLAIHWGHAEAAQIIRLQGGPSLWEQRLGLLQAELEDYQERVKQLIQEGEAKEAKIFKGQEDLIIKHREGLLYKEKMQNAEKVAKNLGNEIQILKGKNQSLTENNESLKNSYESSVIMQARTEKELKLAKKEAEAAASQRDVAVAHYHTAMEKEIDSSKKMKAAEESLWRAEAMEGESKRNCQELESKINALLQDYREVKESAKKTMEKYNNLKEEAADFLLEKKKALIKARRRERALEEMSLEKRQAATTAAKVYSNRIRADNKSRMQKQENLNVAKEKIDVDQKSEEAQIELQQFQKEFAETIKAFAELRGSKCTETASGKGLQKHLQLDSSMRIFRSINSTESRRERNIQRVMTAGIPSLIQRPSMLLNKKPQTEEVSIQRPQTTQPSSS